jgi:ATP-dependent Lon protease
MVPAGLLSEDDRKVLAAHRAGITDVILPARNEADCDDIPEKVSDDVTVYFASDVREVLALALEPAATAAGFSQTAA